jgi:hypothetical protein
MDLLLLGKNFMRAVQVIRDNGSRLEQSVTGRYSLWVKVKLSLCLTKHHAMKTYWGVEV